MSGVETTQGEMPLPTAPNPRELIAPLHTAAEIHNNGPSLHAFSFVAVLSVHGIMDRSEPSSNLLSGANDGTRTGGPKAFSTYTSLSPVDPDSNIIHNGRSRRNWYVLTSLYKKLLTKKNSFQRLWMGSWTAETCSYILAIIALGGLVATLLVHQGKPLPQWPQLVTINSIVSLFSLVMRACVGVVLTEGNWNSAAKT
jgi:hypothetical protein